MPVILKQRMRNKRSLMELCGVIRDLVIVDRELSIGVNINVLG